MQKKREYQNNRRTHHPKSRVRLQKQSTKCRSGTCQRQQDKTKTDLKIQARQNWEHRRMITKKQQLQKFDTK